MGQADSYVNIRIRKRPCYAWLLGIMWLAWLLFWAEAVLGAWKETEPRALVISLVIFLVSLAVGLLAWFRTSAHNRQ